MEYGRAATAGRNVWLEARKPPTTGEKQAHQQLLLQAGRARGNYECEWAVFFRVGIARLEAPYSTTGTTAESDGGVGG